MVHLDNDFFMIVYVYKKVGLTRILQVLST